MGPPNLLRHFGRQTRGHRRRKIAQGGVQGLELPPFAAAGLTPFQVRRQNGPGGCIQLLVQPGGQLRLYFLAFHGGWWSRKIFIFIHYNTIREEIRRAKEIFSQKAAVANPSGKPSKLFSP